MSILTPHSRAKFKVWMDSPHLVPFVALTEPYAPLALGWLDRDTKGGLGALLSKELGYWVADMKVAVHRVNNPEEVVYLVVLRFDQVPEPYTD